MARIEALWVKRAHRGPMDPAESLELREGRGVVGSADQGGLRQITLLDAASWEAAAARLGAPTLDPIHRRANVLVRGLDLEGRRGRVAHLGPCALRLTGPLKPCERMDEALAGLQAALKTGWRAGAACEILRGGTLRADDPVRWDHELVPLDATGPDAWSALHEGLLQRGVSTAQATRRALKLVGALPPDPYVIALGAGVADASLLLAAELPGATIEALDGDARLLALLRDRAAARGLHARISTRVGDASALMQPGAADLIWEEGALAASAPAERLATAAALLKPGGVLAFTERTLRVDPTAAPDTPFWDLAAPHMRKLDAHLDLLHRAGFEPLGHFDLPPRAFNDWSVPLHARVQHVLSSAADATPDLTRAALDLREELELWEEQRSAWVCTFYVARRRA